MKQTLVVVGSIVLLIVVSIVAAYFGRGAVKKGSFDKGQRLTAKPGTTRKNAIALTSNKRPSTADPSSSIVRRSDEQEDDSPLTVKSLSDPSKNTASGVVGDQISEAMHSGSPESGLSALSVAMQLPHDSEQGAYLHEAMGQLYAQLDPPDYEKAKESFEQARELAADKVFEQNVVLKSVQILMLADLDDDAREQLGTVLENGLTDETQFRLRLLHGQLEERAGRAEEAEAIYQEVLGSALAEPDTLDRDSALALARLAGLRLNHLYRAHDRDEAAATLTEDLKRQLKAKEGAI
tara:strand:- start:58 stop:939 length:882 start_codon:yes stop_codon:yes gene_type:complete